MAQQHFKSIEHNGQLQCSLEYSESLASSRHSITDLMEQCIKNVKMVHVRKVKTKAVKVEKVVEHREEELHEMATLRFNFIRKPLADFPAPDKHVLDGRATPKQAKKNSFKKTKKQNQEVDPFRQKSISTDRYGKMKPLKPLLWVTPKLNNSDARQTRKVSSKEFSFMDRLARLIDPTETFDRVLPHLLSNGRPKRQPQTDRILQSLNRRGL